MSLSRNALMRKEMRCDLALVRRVSLRFERYFAPPETVAFVELLGAKDDPHGACGLESSLAYQYAPIGINSMQWADDLYSSL